MGNGSSVAKKPYRKKTKNKKREKQLQQMKVKGNGSLQEKEPAGIPWFFCLPSASIVKPVCS